ncbi:MAG: glycosyltransferase [Verrucomicrobia bacterium]|jgi:hypothetical protein|nr:glycosyltransferase [Verrucomicrobiota bacterium]MBT7066873.1 glycosyltransferase [Verrucomicrobiota bacterium]MBT7699839.1 glycosyltransferase [Verrucomicrobiota bacterium]
MKPPHPQSAPPLPRQAWPLFTVCAGIILLLAIVAARAGAPGLHGLRLPWLGTLPAGRFIAIWCGTWVAGLGLLLALPRGLSPRQAGGLILVLALLCRLALLPMPPSDDINRYLWEGRLVAAQVNPYCYAPHDPALSGLAAGDPYHAAINHPDMSAAYPPVILLIFAAIAQLWYHPMAIKLLITACDLGTIALLLALLRHRCLPPRWAILYAFNPITLFSFSGQAHYDALQGLFLLGALVCYDRRRWIGMFLLAGLAVQTKYVAVLALPFLLRRDNLRYAPFALATMLLPYIPFSGEGVTPLFRSLVTFGDAYAFNGSVHGVVTGLTGSRPFATTLCKLLLVGAILFGWIRYAPLWSNRYRNNPLPGSCFVLGAALLLSPTLHVWYLAWILPFIALRPSGAWLVLSLCAGAYFVTVGIDYHSGLWRLPRVAFIIEWLPFWMLLAVEARRTWLRRRIPVAAAPVASVSVIIPARDEADNIEACINAVRNDPAVHEIIVVDGGSRDGTVHVATEAGAAVVVHDAPPAEGGGRGGQCAAGVRAATGDVIAIVHADARVNTPFFSQSLHVLSQDATLIGGAFGSVFTGTGVPLGLLEFANDLRAAFLGIPFGDQVQFFRRDPIVQLDAYPAIPLMEDVELAVRLRELGRTTYLFGDVQASARAWQSGQLGRAVLIVRLVTGYLWHRRCGRADPLAMYRRYYGGV